MHTCADMFNPQFIWHLWNKHIETEGLFPGFTFFVLCLKCVDVLMCFAVFMSTPCLLSSLPSVFLAWLLSVVNEVMTHTHIHVHTLFSFFFSFFGYPTTLPCFKWFSLLSHGSSVLQDTVYNTHTQVLCPRCICLQTVLLKHKCSESACFALNCSSLKQKGTSEHSVS